MIDVLKKIFCNIYFSTSNRDGRGSPIKEDDRILRVVPAEKERVK